MKDIFLLDMDDTLLDFPKAERENFLKTLGMFGVPATDEIYERFHRINDGLWKLLEKGGITRAELKVRRFADLFAECGISIDAGAVADAYWENFPFVCFPYAGACEFLRELSSRGKIYIVTNGGARIQKQHLKDAGFLPYITAAFISEEIGFDKPSKQFADYVRAHIPDFDESRAVWIGDSLTSDMVCAKNADVDFILYVPRSMPQGYSEPFGRSYQEVLELITRLPFAGKA